jgi:acyl-CoA synthetase (AMP-forming)/AMP-acid ligase II
LVLVPGAETPGEITTVELSEFCRQHIAGYKCPRTLEIVEALPLSAAGKVLKTELRKPYWETTGIQDS